MMINSQNYSKLNAVSSKMPQKSPGKFLKVFLTGAPRENQRVGMYQCLYDFDGQGYLINNAEKVRFIPYFLKRYWEKTEQVQDKTGRKYDKIVAFGWHEDVPKIDADCRYVYLIAGILVDDHNKMVTIPVDAPERGLKKGEPAWIYFVCNGVRYGAIIDLMNAISEEVKNKKLAPLSDSPEFERNVVNPRRFLLSAETAIQDTKYGPKTTYAFKIVAPLPDNIVSKVIEDSDKMLPEFEKQFDKTEYVRSNSKPISEQSNVQESQVSDNTVSFDTPVSSTAQVEIPTIPSQDEPVVTAESVEFKKFDIGI